MRSHQIVSGIEIACLSALLTLGLASCVTVPMPGVYTPTGLQALPDAPQLTLPTEPLLRMNAAAGASANVMSFAADREGRMIATFGSDKSIALWDGHSGQQLRVIRQPEYRERGGMGFSHLIAVSPDGAFVAFAADTVEGRAENAVLVFDVKADKFVQRLGSMSSPVSHLAFSQDGTLLSIGICDIMKGVNAFATYSIPAGQRLFGEEMPANNMIISMGYNADDRLLIHTLPGQRLYDRPDRAGPGGVRPQARSASMVLYEGASLTQDGRTALRAHSNGRQMTIDFINASTLQSERSVRFDAQGKYTMLWFPTLESSSGGVVGILPTGDGRPPTTVLIDTSGKVSPVLDDSAGFIGSIGPDRIGVVTARGLVSLKNGREDRVLIPPGAFGLFSPLKPEELSATANLDSVRIQRIGAGAVEFSFSDRTLATRLSSRSFSALKGENSLALMQRLGVQWTLSPNHWGTRLPGLLRMEGPASIVWDPQDQWIAMGTQMSRLMVYDRPGSLRWERPAPIPVHVVVSSDGSKMLAAMYDGTVRWYRMTDGEEICALFIHADLKRWVLWTPEGYFDCAPGAESLVGYLVNQGPDREANFVAIDQMYDTFYRPDLVAKKINGENLDDVTQAVAKTGDAGSVIRQGLPPKVEILEPRGGAVSGTVKVRARITDGGSGVGRLVWRVNGVSIEGGRGMSVQPAAGSRDAEAELNLMPGENEISLTAFNEKNLIESVPARVKVTSGGAAPAAGKASLYVVAVGINQYRDRDLTLQYSVPDATALAALLKQGGQGVYENVNVVEVHDAEATKAGIRKVLAEATARIQSGDVFVLYMAGHGLALDGVYYFIPSDLVYENEDSVRQNAVSQKDLQEMLSAVPALRSVVLLDTCNSGAFATPGMRGLATKTAMDKLTRATGRATLSASTEAQAAMEGYKGHGVFTYALLEGLRGEADGQGNKDHQVTINEWAEYVGTKVPELTKAKWGYEQFPMQNLQGRPFVIGAVTP